MKKKLKNKLIEGQKRNRKRSFSEKALQSEIPSKYDEADYEWLKCNTDPRKTASILHCRSRWSNQEHERRSEDLLKTTNAGYVGSIEKQSSTSCQDVKNWQDQNMSNATAIHTTFWRLSGQWRWG